MSGGSKETDSKTAPWEAQQPYLTKGFSEAGKIYDQGPQEYFPGQTYTDMSPFRQAGLTGTADIAQGGNPLVTNASNYAANTLGGQGDNPYADILNGGVGGMQKTANGDFLNANPYLDQTFDAANKKLTNTFQNDTLPAIAAGLGMSGNAGSTTSDLLGAEAGGKLADAQSSLAANIYGGNYQSERDRMAAASSGLTNTGAGLYGTGVNERLNLAGQAPGLREAQYGDAAKLGAVGSEYEGQQGKAIQDQIARYNFAQGADMSALQDYMSMIQGNYGSTSTSRESTQSSPLQTLIGAGMTAASMYPSDRRLKKRIRHVATTSDGLKIYSFKYKAGGPAQLGLMAQEVEKKYPHAVGRYANGMRGVDYEQALANSEMGV